MFDVLLVELDPQAGLGGHVDVALLVLEDVRVGQVVEDVTTPVVVNVKALFLDQCVRRAGVDWIQEASAIGPSGQWGASATS